MRVVVLSGDPSRMELRPKCEDWRLLCALKFNRFDMIRFGFLSGVSMDKLAEKLLASGENGHFIGTGSGGTDLIVISEPELEFSLLGSNIKS